MEFRPATKSDIEAFMGSVPFSARAYAAEEDGTIYGVGGIYYQQGNVIAFTYNRPDMPKRDRIRGGRVLLEMFKGINAPIWAIPGPVDTADATLRHFGFIPVPDSNFYIWSRT